MHEVLSVFLKQVDCVRRLHNLKVSQKTIIAESSMHELQLKLDFHILMISIDILRYFGDIVPEKKFKCDPILQYFGLQEQFKIIFSLGNLAQH